MNQKKCINCQEIKEITEFSFRKDRDKFRNQCRCCQNNQKYHRPYPQIVKPPQGYKFCKICKEIKTIQEFYYGFRECKKCVSVRRSKNKEENQKKSRIYREAHCDKLIFNAAKNRAKNNNLNFNLTLDDIIIPKICPVLGIEIKISNGNFSDNSPTLDRIIMERGYVKGNVMVISWRANRLKNNGTIKDFEQIIDYMKKYS